MDTIDALTEARAHGATTVAITNFPWSPITEVADFVLLTAARETAFRSGAMTSRIAQLTVVDCLFVTLAQRDLPHTMEALERTFAAAQAKRVRRTTPPKVLIPNGSGSRAGSALDPPTRLARLIWRCEAANSITTGSQTITTAAASSVNSDSLEP